MIEPPNSLFDTAAKPVPPSQIGRRGNRAKLAEKALNDLCQVWDEQGIEAVRRMAFHDPSGFVKTVAGLLPQKIEHTFPTDGLSDDRLADLLQIADEMAQRLGIIDEKRLIDVTPEEGGGGPERFVDAAGGVVSPLSPSAENSAEPNLHNRLEDTPPVATQSTEEAILPYPVGRACPPSAEAEKRDNLRKLTNYEEPEIDPASLF